MARRDRAGRPVRLLLNTLPKSGSIYLTDTLSRALRLPIKRVGTVSFNDDRIVPPWLDEFSRGAAIALQHLAALGPNLALLRHYRIDRLVLHVRDPRQATLSWTRFLETQEEPTVVRGQWLPKAKALREFWVEHMRYRGVAGLLNLGPKAYRWLSNWWRPPTAEFNVRANVRAIYDMPEDYWNWELARRIDWDIEHHLPATLRWLEGWADVLDDPQRDLQILLTHYRDLRDEPQQLFRDIYEFFDLDVAHLPKARPPVAGELCYRRGELDEWRRVFTAEQARRATAMMPPRLLERFQWQP